MRKIILISLCMILVAGCGKKQPQVQKPQQSSTETQPIVTMKEIQTKKQPPQQLYPVMAEKSRKIPLWVNEMISVYNTNYDAWREKSSTDTSSVLISSLTSQGFTPSAPSAPVSVPTTPQLSHSTGLPGTEKPSSIIRGPMASTQGSSQTRISTSPQSSATQSPVEPEKPDSSGETTPQPPQPQPQVAGVDIVRTIQNTAEGAYVRLNVNVKDTRVNGIIVTENLP
ncbi:MAG: hypothetical protein NC913_04020, partial [Candidatus Omnitrophica bacterium]|nr:hypothetical protein [Candidatus Omnitrophota bacterium]